MRKITSLLLALYTLCLVLFAAAVAVQAQGPGPAPDPWGFDGSLYYSTSGVKIPQSVAGGGKGAGTLNVGGFYIAGQQVVISTAANSLKGNATGSSAPMADVSVPSCDGATDALNWTTSSGFSCNTIAAFMTAITTGQGVEISIGTCTPGVTSVTSIVVLTACQASTPQTSSRSLANTDGGQIIVWNGSNLTATITTPNTGGNFEYAWGTDLLNINATALQIALSSATVNGCPIPWVPPNGSMELQSAGATYNCSLTLPPFTWARTVAGSTDTLSISDCYLGVLYTATSGSVAITVPDTLPKHCPIKVMQAGTVQPTFSIAGTGTLLNPHSYTKTFGQGSVLNFDVTANSDGAHAIVSVNGDGT